MKMNLENVMISEKSHTLVTYYMIPLIEISRIGKPIETEGILVVTMGWAGGGGWWVDKEIGSSCLMATGYFLGVMKTFRDRQKWWLHNTVNVLNFTNLCILKCLLSHYVHFT